jgi:hypothetical protein
VTALILKEITMVIVKTNLMFKGFDAFTVFPFIFVRPAHASNEGLLVHEKVHYAEQKKAFVLPWLLKYALSKPFRQAAEVRAYRAQVAAGGISVGKAANMLTKYGLGLDFINACRLLRMRT